MHIAIISPYSMSQPGGVQEHARGLARALVAKGHDVTLFGPELRGEQERLDRVATVSLGPAVNIPANGSIAPLGIDPRMAVRLDLTLDAADVIHCHEPFLPAGLIALLRRPKKTAVVGTFHAAAEKFWPYAITSPLLRLASRRLDATTAVSPEARRLVRRYVNVDPDIVPNGVDAPFYASTPPEKLAPRQIVFCGRNEPRKGMSTVLGAFAEIAKHHDDVHLVCFPATDEDVPPGQFARDRIHCLGRVSEERKASLMRGADICCFAANGGESFGMVVLEAMAAGSAVIASDIPGYRYAGGDVPLYATPDDVPSWVAALDKLLGDDAMVQQMSSDGPARAALFDWSNIAEQSIQAYQRALANL